MARLRQLRIRPEYGPMVAFTVSASPSRSRGGATGIAAKRRAVDAKGLIDAHNNRTVVDLELLRRARARCVGTVEDINGDEYGLYEADIRIMGHVLSKLLVAAESRFGPRDATGTPAFQAFLGRDILQHCRFIYDERAGFFSLDFSPSERAGTGMQP
jgi:hypothetical protein